VQVDKLLRLALDRVNTMTYYPVIGLEIHVQLNTTTKLFCHCLNTYAPNDPNTNICPFCTGQPGALPVLNKAAVEKAIIFGVAVGSTIPEKTRWDRKNYFYPDLPTGYQISQYDNPIVEGGKIDFYVEDKQTGQFSPYSVVLTRAHLESDAAKLLHSNGKTYVDFNRSGCPLVEIVTEPVIHSSSQAMAFVNELQAIVRALGVSDADMEKGQMRFDCNVSLQNETEHASNSLPSYRTETKNINSVRSLGRAIEYEISRQTVLLEKGEKPVQETRGWKDDLNRSESQRSKEDAMDYRYFPEPDLQILEISRQDLPVTLPELPSVSRQKFMDSGLSLQAANTLIGQPSIAQLYTDAVQDTSPELSKHIANILTSTILGVATKEEIDGSTIVTAEELRQIAEYFSTEKINNKGVLKIIETKVKSKSTIDEIIKSENLMQVTDDSALTTIVNQVIQENPSVIEEYKSGKVQVVGFLVGQCMKAARGQGNPKRFNELLAELIQ
jgi:aspartyl-tRNA(Asn)/glutamyl-tRNA(Gln) amidotransferase subunit B